MSADIFGWFGIVCMALSCVLLGLARRSLTDATEKWREAGRLYDEISKMLADDEAAP